VVFVGTLPRRLLTEIRHIPHAISPVSVPLLKV
jgi:hypothetical protein